MEPVQWLCLFGRGVHAPAQLTACICQPHADALGLVRMAKKAARIGCTCTTRSNFITNVAVASASMVAVDIGSCEASGGVVCRL